VHEEEEVPAGSVSLRKHRQEELLTKRYCGNYTGRDVNK
jgi:hypothetical protein